LFRLREQVAHAGPYPQRHHARATHRLDVHITNRNDRPLHESKPPLTTRVQNIHEIARHGHRGPDPRDAAAHTRFGRSPTRVTLACFLDSAPSPTDHSAELVERRTGDPEPDVVVRVRRGVVVAVRGTAVVGVVVPVAAPHHPIGPLTEVSHGKAYRMLRHLGNSPSSHRGRGGMLFMDHG